MGQFVDFKEVKACVSMLQVLYRYNVSLKKVNESYMRGDCPLPQHAGSKNTFGVNTDKSIWSCQSRSCIDARAGKKGGNVLDFVAWMDRCSIRDAALKLAEWFNVAAPVAAVPQREVPSQAQIGLAFNPPLAFTLKDIQHEHRYLLGRGFEEEECEYLGCGYFPGKGMMRSRIVFPIHDASGQLVAYAGRSTEDAEPRWMFPTGFQKMLVVFNLHRVEEDTVIVCESFWGVLACVRAGIMNAVSVMGHFISPEQAALLSRFRQLTVLFDGDEYGEEGIAQALTVLPAAEVVRLPKGKQPDHLAPDYLRSLLGQPEDFGEYEVVDEETMTA